MHIFQRVYDRIIKSLRHSVLVKKAYSTFAKRVTQGENTKEEKKGREWVTARKNGIKRSN